MNSIAATSNPNYTGCIEESGFSTTADGNNHLPLFGYDSSGNAQSDGSISYACNGESQLKSATNNGTTTNYLYDGDGRRVAKVGSKLYWYGSGDDILAETDASGNTTAEYIFFGGKRIAMLPAGGNPTYYVEDMLGTSRVLTTSAGVVCYDADFYPYGGERSYTNTCPQNYKFEGKERDTETGNDDFGARYYSNRFGRWLSADWSAVPEAVPYANLSNPQTLNLYAMVSDDPESFADLDGHDGWDIVIGVVNALANNFVGSPRVENGNADLKSGQTLGDALSFTGGGAATVAIPIGSGALDVGSGGLAAALTPVEAMATAFAANGALHGGANLLNDALQKSDASTDSSSTPRKSSEQIRKEWEAESGEKWPKDEKTGRNQDVSHKKALADQGTNELSNIEPKPHDEHMQQHMKNGDFKRWGSRRKLKPPKPGADRLTNFKEQSKPPAVPKRGHTGGPS